MGGGRREGRLAATTLRAGTGGDGTPPVPSDGYSFAWRARDGRVIGHDWPRKGLGVFTRMAAGRGGEGAKKGCRAESAIRWI